MTEEERTKGEEPTRKLITRANGSADICDTA